MRYYCTYFDANYLPAGIALIRSLASRENATWTIYVVCLDEITRLILEKIAIPQVHCVALHLLEKGDGSLLAAKRNRSTIEYYWTLTPTILLRILDWYPEIEVLTYLDADLFFFSSPQPIFDEFSRFSVLIHEHRFPPRLLHLEADAGKFNVGLLCFRRDEHGLRVLHRWREQCNSWCYARAEGGKYGDQAYLSAWPTDFEGVGVLEHVGAGLAPWNYEQYRLVPPPLGSSAPPTVNGRPVVFYHFHALVNPCRNLYIPIKLGTVYVLSASVLLGCYWPYIMCLHEAVNDVALFLAHGTRSYFQNVPPSQFTTCLVPAANGNIFEDETRSAPRVELPFGWSCIISERQPIFTI